ncbi:MAG: hypothetical protein IPO83_14640 [Chitinophagaceae bacterium]|nr:hypothetical protein [Chitinophagaceae bacterium]
MTIVIFERKQNSVLYYSIQETLDLHNNEIGVKEEVILIFEYQETR